MELTEIHGQTALKRPVRILQTIRQGFVGGGESHLLTLVEKLDRNKFDSVVLSFSNGPMVDRLNALGIRTYVLESKRAFDITVWKRVGEIVRQENVEIIHAHGTRAASNVFFSALRQRLPLVYTIHGWSFHDLQAPLVRKFRILGERFLTSVARKNITVSRSNQRTGQLHFPGFRSTVIYNGIDVHRFDPEKKYHDIRSELGIDAKSLLFVFIARFEEQKQPVLLLEAYAEVLKNIPKSHLLMVGDGTLKEMSMRIAKEKKIMDHVTFLPFRQDVPALLAASDVYLLPSLWEGLPIGLTEAMAMKKVVIASDVDGVRELVESEETGLLLRKGRLYEDLVEKMTRIGSDPDLLRRLSMQAHRQINAKFGIPEMIERIMEVYLDVVAVKNAAGKSSGRNK